MVKHFIEVEDYSKEDLLAILSLAEAIKKEPQAYYEKLKGNALGLLFEKPSTRTRISFEVGMHQLGGTSLRLMPSEIQLGEREEIRDVARTMSRFLSIVALRTFSHDVLKEFAANASIPVVNALSDYSHPCQAMADVMTLREKFKDVAKIRLAYVGDGNNVLHSLLFLFSKIGLRLTYASPKGFKPDAGVVARCQKFAKASGAQIIEASSPAEAVREADVVYTDVFISMGEEQQRERKLKAFSGYQVNTALLAKCRKKPLIMHCLPAHRGEEITDEVIESPGSIVFDQAENRLHAQKGIMLYLLQAKALRSRPKK